MEIINIQLLVLSSVFSLSLANPLHIRSAKYETELQPPFQNGVFGLGFQLNVRQPIIGLRFSEMKNMNKFMGPMFTGFQPKFPTNAPRTNRFENSLTPNMYTNESPRINEKDIRNSDVRQETKQRMKDVTTEKIETTTDNIDTTYETTTDFEFTTPVEDDGLLSRAGVSSQLLASLVG